jgi:alpha-glucosidase
VKRAVYDAFAFWLDRGIDGYRIDTVYMYVKDRRLRDNPPARFDPGSIFDRRDPIMRSRYLDALVPEYFRWRHIHDQDQPESLAIMRDLRRIADRHGRGRDTLLLGEVDIDTRTGVDLCRNGMSVGNNFALLKAPWSAEAWAKVLTREREAIDRFWCTNTFSNHDGSRGISRHATADADETQARGRILLAMALLLRGVPMLYYGEELGLLDAEIPQRELKDPMSRRWHYLPGSSGLKRDVARSPMPWSATANAGFTSGRPWIRLGSDWKTRNVAAQQRDPASTWHYTRALIALRNRVPALQTGSFRLLPRRPRGCLAFLRELGGERWLVAANFTAGELRLRLPGGARAQPEVAFSGRVTADGEAILGGYAVLVTRLDLPAGAKRSRPKQR